MMTARGIVPGGCHINLRITFDTKDLWSLYQAITVSE